MAVSKSRIEANKTYEKNNYDRILVRFPKGTKDKIMEAASEEDQSVNNFIVNTICDKLNIARPVLKELETLKGKKAEPSGSQQEDKTEEESPEPQNIDIQALYKEYGRDTILSALGQVAIYSKYGESILHELVEYARTQQIEQD